MDPLITFIPAAWTVPILVIKGVLSVGGVVLLTLHMDAAWGSMQDWAQKARYLLLLGYGVLVSGATAEQLQEGVELSYRHLGSLIMSIALVVVAVYSIYSHRRKERS